MYFTYRKIKCHLSTQTQQTSMNFALRWVPCTPIVPFIDKSIPEICNIFLLMHIKQRERYHKVLCSKCLNTFQVVFFLLLNLRIMSSLMSKVVQVFYFLSWACARFFFLPHWPCTFFFLELPPPLPQLLMVHP